MHWHYTYYKYRQGAIEAHTEILVQIDEHNHAADEAMSPGKIWAPNVEDAAQSWMAEAAKPTRHALQSYLLSLGHKNLPDVQT